MKLYLVLIGCLLTMGCASANLRTTTTKGMPNAPVNEVRGGTVDYLNDGYAWVRTKRRADAYKKMHDYCQGDYKIVSENTEQGAGSSIPSAYGNIYATEHRVQIRFECVTSSVPTERDPA